MENLPLALIILFAFVLLLSWGAGTHLWAGIEVLERCKKKGKTTENVKLILSHQDCFLYGCIAADLISFKRYGGFKNHCHNWNMRERMAPHLQSPGARSFALGYLCHLAADIGSHNFFVPYHRLAELPPVFLGHTYWENRVDTLLGKPYWGLIEELRRNQSFRAFDKIIDNAVQVKAFSMGSNRLIFHTLVLAQKRPAWQKARSMLERGKNKYELNAELLELLKEKMLSDMLSLLHDGSPAFLFSQDPAGTVPLRAARIIRRQLLLQYGNRASALPVARRLAKDCFWPPDWRMTERSSR